MKETIKTHIIKFHLYETLERQRLYIGIDIRTIVIFVDEVEFSKKGHRNILYFNWCYA